MSPISIFWPIVRFLLLFCFIIQTYPVIEALFLGNLFDIITLYLLGSTIIMGSFVTFNFIHTYIAILEFRHKPHLFKRSMVRILNIFNGASFAFFWFYLLPFAFLARSNDTGFYFSWELHSLPLLIVLLLIVVTARDIWYEVKANSVKD